MWDDHTPLTLERKSALENIGFVWKTEKGSAGKGPTRKKNKIPYDSKKGICDGYNMTHYGILLFDEGRSELRGKMTHPSSGKYIKVMCNHVKNEQPIGNEVINQVQDGNFDCKTNGDQPRLSFSKKR